MNSYQAKQQFNIHDYLKAMNCTADEKRKNFYRVRGERTASLHVTDNGRGWFDHGTGQGGSIIDLVAYLNNCDVREALLVLGDSEGIALKPKQNAPSSFHQQYSEPVEVDYMIDDVRSLKHPELLNYLNNRGIEIAVAKRFCKEVQYTTGGLSFCSIGFKNDSNGWEIRAARYKGNLLGKDISTIVLSDSTTINVFEGFFDMLSYYQLKKNNDNSLVLNSTSLTSKALPVLQKFDKVRLFLDNDKSGEKATETLKKRLLNSENCAVHYKRFQDLNEYLQKR